MKNNFDGLKAVYVNCTLKKSPIKSHTRDLMDVSIQIMESEGVSIQSIRLADYYVPVGVQPDMTKEGENQDEWPNCMRKS